MVSKASEHNDKCFLEAKMTSSLVLFCLNSRPKNQTHSAFNHKREKHHWEGTRGCLGLLLEKWLQWSASVFHLINCLIVSVLYRTTGYNTNITSRIKPQHPHLLHHDHSIIITKWLKQLHLQLKLIQYQSSEQHQHHELEIKKKPLKLSFNQSTCVTNHSLPVWSRFRLLLIALQNFFSWRKRGKRYGNTTDPLGSSTPQSDQHSPSDTPVICL